MFFLPQDLSTSIFSRMFFTQFLYSAFLVIQVLAQMSPHLKRLFTVVCRQQIPTHTTYYLFYYWIPLLFLTAWTGFKIMLLTCIFFFSVLPPFHSFVLLLNISYMRTGSLFCSHCYPHNVPDIEQTLHPHLFTWKYLNKGIFRNAFKVYYY